VKMKNPTTSVWEKISGKEPCIMTAAIHILYVDDEPSLLDIGKLFLEEGGQFSVDTITSASAALTLLNAKNYNAIISDYQMPGMDGIEFLKRVRTSGNTIPFILFTGRGREEVVIQALNEGADFYLQKGGEPVAQFTELAHKTRQAVQQRQAESSIRDHERREADIINFLPDATFAIDTKGVVIAWNHAMEKMTGVKAAEMLGKGNYEYSIPVYCERRPILIDLILHDDPTIAAKYPSLNKDGRNLVAEAISPNLFNGKGAAIWFTAAPLYNNKGEVVGAIESIRDISERKQAEEVLKESEEKFRGIFENTSVPIFHTRADGSIVSVNLAFAQHLGYSTPEEAIREIPDIRMIYAYPEQRDRLFRILGNENSVNDFELTLKRKDGSLLWFSINCRAIHGNDGKIIGIEGLAVNITKRKWNEDALRESEVKYRSVIENIQDVYYRSDRNGNLILVSPSILALLGYDSINDIIGKPISETFYFDPAERDKFLTLMEKTGSIRDYETRLRKKDGTPVEVSTSSIYYYTAHGEIAGIEGIFRDITDRKRMDEALFKSEEKYRMVFENTGTAMVTFEESGIISLANEEFARLSGFSKDTIEGKMNWRDFVIREDMERMLAQNRLRKENREDALTHYEFRFVTKSADIRTIFLSIDVIPETKKSVASLLDITDRRKNEDALLKKSEELSAANEQIAAAEEELRANLDELARQDRALRESKKELADIIEFLPDATFAINTSGVVIAWNHAMEVMTGVKKEDILNKGNYEYSLPFYRKRLPILIDLVFGYDDSVADTYQGIRKDGDRLIAEIFIPHLHNGRGAYLWFTTSPLYDSQGKITGAIESIREITEHKERESALNLRNEELSAAYEEITSTEEELRQQVEEIAAAQQALQESEKRYRNIVEDQTEFISRFLPDGTHIFVNDAYCRYFGVAQEDVLGHRFKPVLHADDRAAIFAFFASLTPEKPVGTIDQRIIMPDGTTHWQRWNDRALFDDKGKVVEYQSVGRDITEYKRAEESIKKSEEMFHGLVDTITSGVAIYEVRNDGTSGRDYIIKDFNKMALKIEGKNKDEVVGRSLFDLRPTIDDYGLIPVFRQVWKTGVPAYFPQKVYIDDKYSNWYENRVFRLPSGEIVAVYDDVTERKQVELELLSYQEKLKEAHHLAHIGTWDWVIETDTVTWSEELYDIAGWDVTKPAPTYAEHKNLYTPDSWDRLNNAVTKALTTGQPYNLELEMVRTNGNLRWVNAFGGVIRDKNGTVTGFHGTVQDISERKQAEELKNRFGRILESSLNEIYVFDAQTFRFVDVNYGARENIGYTMDELRTMTPLDITTEYTKESFETLIAPLRMGEKEIQIVFTDHKRKDGSLYPVEVHLQLAGHEISPVFVAIVLDITERKQTEDALLKANWKLNLLSGITRHDIKNQMTVLRGYITFLGKKQSDPLINDYIQKMDTSARRISSMIQFTKEYDEIGITIPVWQDIRTLVATAAKEVSFGEIPLKNDLPDGIEVFSEPLVFKVFYNLMDNAVRYGDTITTIRFSVEERNGDKVIVCEDDGVGVPAEDKERIFERGFGKNTGLGLALSQEILEITGISIEENGEPGKGARFEMTVPYGMWRVGKGA